MIRILCQEKSVSEYVITLIEDKRAAQTEELKQIFQKYTDKPVVVKKNCTRHLHIYSPERQERRCIASDLFI